MLYLDTSRMRIVLRGEAVTPRPIMDRFLPSSLRTYSHQPRV